MMCRAAALLVAAAATASSGAAAQSIWAGETRLALDTFVECAVILSRVETIPGDAPSFYGGPVDFARISEEMFYRAAVLHGETLTASMAASHDAFWGDAEDTLTLRTRVARRLDACWAFILPHLTEPDGRARFRLSREELGLAALPE
ncbi:MAG: hypothetical protein AAF914_08075 [Pseudomonadota bacterium]